MHACVCEISKMKTVLVFCCIFAVGDTLSSVIPPKDYLTKFDDGKVHPLQIIDLVSDEEHLLSSRVGRQYYSQKGQSTQPYDGYYVKGYNNYYIDYPDRRDSNRRNSYQMQRHRRRFGGIGSAIIV